MTSPLTNALLIGGAVGGVYLFAEYLPQRRRKQKKAAACPAGQRRIHASETSQHPPGTRCVSLCPAGSSYNTATGACDPLVEPPGLIQSLKEPPSAGQALHANTREEALHLMVELMGVPTAILMPFSKGTVYQQVKPIFDQLVVAYPEIQFVESDVGAMIGQERGEALKSNVVAFDVGLELGPESPHTDGVSLLLAEGPKTGLQQMQENGEPVLPRWSMTDVDIRDLANATAEMQWPLEVLEEKVAAMRGGSA